VAFFLNRNILYHNKYGLLLLITSNFRTAFTVILLNENAKNLAKLFSKTSWLIYSQILCQYFINAWRRSSIKTSAFDEILIFLRNLAYVAKLRATFRMRFTKNVAKYHFYPRLSGRVVAKVDFLISRSIK
jgi:hypothetical protein